MERPHERSTAFWDDDSAIKSPLKMQAELDQVVDSMKALASTKVGRERAWREEQLSALELFLKDMDQELVQALHEDLRKPLLELSEVDMCLNELRYHKQHLTEWMRPTYYSTPLTMLPGHSYTIKQPKGCVLIIVPFNFPVSLAIGPLMAALAAGNTCVMKLNELCPQVSSALAYLPRYVQGVSVVQGSVAITEALLKKSFDHIFFTGSPRVGRLVQLAAAEHLCPTTLELGGKCPTIITEQTDIKVAAKRVAWSKWANTGQVCVTTDYVLIPKDLAKPFVDEIVAAFLEFVGLSENTQDQDKIADAFRASNSYGRIVSVTHAKRLKGLIEDAREKGAEVVFGGVCNVEEKFVCPTVLIDVNPDTMKIMEDEIFGPLLPIVTVKDLDEAIDFVNARPHPLALYLYSNQKHVCDSVIARTSSGGVCVQDCIMQVVHPEMPFGGVGNSGMGAYHGKHGFDTFSHERAVLVRPTYMDAKERYPPATKEKHAMFKKVMSLDPCLFNSHTLWNFGCLLSLGTAMIAAAAVVLPQRQRH